MNSERINFLAVVTAVAGLTGFIGVYAKWFSYEYAVEGGSVTIFLDGTWDVTGALAVSGGIGALAFGCAYMLLTDPGIRRIVVLLMVISSVVLLLASLFGFTRVDEAVTDAPLMPGATSPVFTATVALGLVISLVSGVLATVASVLLVVRRESGEEDEGAATNPA
jgi:multisubunit Na+/H+ antiporter MnhC subunit